MKPAQGGFAAINVPKPKLSKNANGDNKSRTRCSNKKTRISDIGHKLKKRYFGKNNSCTYRTSYCKVALSLALPVETKPARQEKSFSGRRERFGCLPDDPLTGPRNNLYRSFSGGIRHEANVNRIMPSTKTFPPIQKSATHPRCYIDWARPGDFRTSRKIIDWLINQGFVEAYIQTLPGSKRHLCFVSIESFSRWVKTGQRKGPKRIEEEGAKCEL